MIWESAPWKKALIQDAALLERWSVKKLTPHVEFAYERKIMLAAYSVRKLFDAEKLSSALRNQAVPYERYSSKAAVPRLTNWHRVDEFYDFTRPIEASMTVWGLINQLVHSYVFMLQTMDEYGPVTGFLVTSDRGRRKQLCAVDLAVFCSLMRQVGRDYPSHVHMEFDPKRGDFLVTSW